MLRRCVVGALLTHEATRLPDAFVVLEADKVCVRSLLWSSLPRHDRIEDIGQGVQAMSTEEAYHWFSKCSAGPDAPRAQKALRILLDGWFQDINDLIVDALRRFLETHRPELMEHYI